MPLTNEDKYRLRRVGFLEEEIRAFDEAVDPAGKPQKINLDTGTWRDAMRSRLAWLRNMKRVGIPDDRIAAGIRRYYRMGSGRSPWDFLKIEYRPPRRLTDYQIALKSRQKAQVSRAFPFYGRKKI